ncbi:MAG: thioredoxin family protein [Candidatus Methanofastidiosa archaeon]|jgi:glutaredoxin|nr:thioredoxin family protein [Candidatus Methanofastidiosa archaeon]MDD4281526.1 thioredoxin family protein [Candidatus Methanofastidiosa archaeon]
MEMTFFKSKNCPQCPRAQANVEEVMTELGLPLPVPIVDISTTEGRIEALNNMVMSTPSLKIGEEIYGKEDLLDKGRLRALFSG